MKVGEDGKIETSSNVRCIVHEHLSRSLTLHLMSRESRLHLSQCSASMALFGAITTSTLSHEKELPEVPSLRAMIADPCQDISSLS